MYILKFMLNQSVPLDRVFRAMADPARQAMVERLSRGPAPVRERARPLVITLSAVVRHFAKTRISLSLAAVGLRPALAGTWSSSLSMPPSWTAPIRRIYADKARRRA
jgi:DNA-binding transcriptional ArsR family regulator